jgi:hypothetical protein
MARAWENQVLLNNSSGPVFIGGAGRSGTTLLRVMLDAHPRIFCGPELKILPALAEAYQNLTRNFASVVQAYAMRSTDVQRRFRDFIDGLVENARLAAGKPRWAEKTPHNLLFMVALAEIFPNARFLHVVRDGRDVACSLLNMNWVNPQSGRKWDYVQNMANAALYWRDVVTMARRQAEHPAAAGRVLEVRYEALVADAEGTLRRILEFIDEPWDPAVLSHHAKERGHEPLEASTEQAIKPVTARSIGRWKRARCWPATARRIPGCGWASWLPTCWRPTASLCRMHRAGCSGRRASTR